MSPWTQEDVDKINAKRGASLPAHIPPPKKRHKYHAEATEASGFTFDSRKESRRYQELVMMQRSGLIQDLKIQPHYALAVAVIGADALRDFNAGKISGTRIVGEYHADFSYSRDGHAIVEDVKSPATRTKFYQLKKRIFEAQYQIQITET